MSRSEHLLAPVSVLLGIAIADPAVSSLYVLLPAALPNAVFVVLLLALAFARRRGYHAAVAAVLFPRPGTDDSRLQPGSRRHRRPRRPGVPVLPLELAGGRPWPGAAPPPWRST